jgi:copper oxidase (laccase) domain-containing protein
MVSYQKQVHEDKINTVSSFGSCGESDALITTTKKSWSCYQQCRLSGNIYL